MSDNNQQPLVRLLMQVKTQVEPSPDLLRILEILGSHEPPAEFEPTGSPEDAHLAFQQLLNDPFWGIPHPEGVQLLYHWLEPWITRIFYSLISTHLQHVAQYYQLRLHEDYKNQQLVSKLALPGSQKAPQLDATTLDYCFKVFCDLAQRLEPLPFEVEFHSEEDIEKHVEEQSAEKKKSSSNLILPN